MDIISLIIEQWWVGIGNFNGCSLFTTAKFELNLSKVIPMVLIFSFILAIIFQWILNISIFLYISIISSVFVFFLLFWTWMFFSTVFSFSIVFFCKIPCDSSAMHSFDTYFYFNFGELERKNPQVMILINLKSFYQIIRTPWIVFRHDARCLKLVRRA